MGNLGLQEICILLFIIGFIAIPFICYRLGKQSGYRQGLLDGLRGKAAEKD
jgi:hypothetical protein